jgi:energy-coupling factor transporter ATP-binding protein EcfA2
MGQYDLEEKKIVQSFSGDHKLPEQWNIGLIVGNSGTGKSSIAKKCFGEFSQCEWNNDAIIENFDHKFSMEKITEILGSVGFNSVPYWLKPFHVLSNGEKQRVELARLALEKDFIIFDEFSSMVDRDVAKSMSNSIQKMIRKNGKQFIAITCHKDLKEWLLPDWIYDTDDKVFFCPKKNEQKNSNSTSQEAIKANGNFIKSIII